MVRVVWLAALTLAGTVGARGAGAQRATGTVV